MEKKPEEKRINRIKLLDTVTTILRTAATIIAVVISLAGVTALSKLSEAAKSGLENMPSGEGPADGYIVIGKLTGSFMAGLAEIALMVMIFLAVVTAIVGILLCAFYYYNRIRFRKTLSYKYLRRNFITKAVFNGINIALSLWILAENLESWTSLIVPGAAVIGMIAVEAVFILNIRERSK